MACPGLLFVIVIQLLLVVFGLSYSVTMALASISVLHTTLKLMGRVRWLKKTLEMYLHCFTSAKPKQWVKWLSWAKFCYYTS